jgi:hypothetical protein
VRYGPKYLFCGSHLTDHTLLLRLMLEGLNTQARQYSEIITILDDGSLPGLEFEVSMFRHLEHRTVKTWVRPSIVVAFMDRLSHNRDTADVLKRAETEGINVYVVSAYRS